MTLLTVEQLQAKLALLPAVWEVSGELAQKALHTQKVVLEANIHVEDPGAFKTPWDAIQRFRPFEQIAAKKPVASLALLATPEEGPLIEAICAENPNSLMGLSDLAVPQTTAPDF